MIFLILSCNQCLHRPDSERLRSHRLSLQHILGFGKGVTLANMARQVLHVEFWSNLSRVSIFTGPVGGTPKSTGCLAGISKAERVIATCLKHTRLSELVPVAHAGPFSFIHSFFARSICFVCGALLRFQISRSQGDFLRCPYSATALPVLPPWGFAMLFLAQRKSLILFSLLFLLVI